MTFLRVSIFSVLAMLFFAAFTNMLPQVHSSPAVEEEVSTEGMDMDAMIAYGETLFKGKGTCTLCHNGMGRAPDLLEMDLATTFPARLSDPRYTGVAAGQEGSQAVQAYIHESMIDPSAYVVAGFGKKGSNDTESPMPTIDQPPIELNEVQMNAITAFLQDRAGMEPTVPLPGAGEGPAPAAADDNAVAEDDSEPLATTAQEAIDKFYCSACHDLEGSEADVGPDLHGIGERMDKGEIMEAIFDPNAEIAEGYEADIMPPDFSEQMAGSELMLLVDYLYNLPKQGQPE